MFKKSDRENSFTIKIWECLSRSFYKWRFVHSFCFLAALCGVFGSLCLNRGLQLEKAAPAALMRNVDILLAFVFDYAIFGQQPRVLTLLGGLLVMLSTGGVALAKWWRSRDSL